MTVILDIYDGSVSSDDSGEWITKLEASGQLYAGKYKVFAYCEYAVAIKNHAVNVRVLIDDVERCFESTNFSEVDSFKHFSPIGVISILEDMHSIQLQFKTMDSGISALIRRAQIVVEKF